MKEEPNMDSKKTQDQITEITELCKKFAGNMQIIEQN